MWSIIIFWNLLLLNRLHNRQNLTLYQLNFSIAPSLFILLWFNPPLFLVMRLDYFHTHLCLQTHTHTSWPIGSRWEHYNSHRFEYICHLARCSQTQVYHHSKSLGSRATEWHFTFKSKAVTPALFGMIVFWTGARVGGGTCGYNNIIWIRMALITNNGRRNTWNKELL